MKSALENLKTQVQNISGKYSTQKKRVDLERAFEILAGELNSPHVQSQRVMQLLRGIISAQPGSAKAVNRFLATPSVARAMSVGNNFHLKG
jgi:hypothetical protein